MSWFCVKWLLCSLPHSILPFCYYFLILRQHLQEGSSALLSGKMSSVGCSLCNPCQEVASGLSTARAVLCEREEVGKRSFFFFFLWYFSTLLCLKIQYKEHRSSSSYGIRSAHSEQGKDFHRLGFALWLKKFTKWQCHILCLDSQITAKYVMVSICFWKEILSIHLFWVIIFFTI